MVSSRANQPGIFDRISTTRNTARDASNGMNNFDLFSKNNSRDSIHGLPPARKRTSPLGAVGAKRHPSPLNLLPQDDSFYISTHQEQYSPMVREKKFSKPVIAVKAPITD